MIDKLFSILGVTIFVFVIIIIALLFLNWIGCFINIRKRQLEKEIWELENKKRNLISELDKWEKINHE